MVQLPNHINNTIEDAICYLGGSFGHLLDEREQIAIQQFDQPIIKSLTNQIEKGLAFTQKQGPIGIRLVTRYVNALARVGFDTEKLVNEKPFAKPFAKPLAKTFAKSFAKSLAKPFAEPLYL